ncbi:MAG: hypothetical protein V4614_08925 [Pseudomonadota bacterium]
MKFNRDNLILWVIAISLLFPLFIQISGGIYSNPEVMTDSGGVLNLLPLPISIGACFLGILVLARNCRQAMPAVLFIAVFAALMLGSALLATTSHTIDKRKVLIAIQFLLPTFGIVLGQLVSDRKDIIPRAFMGVLLLIVPFQLLAGWWQKMLTLTHNLYVFSIYQHFQFVPVIFVLAYCLVMVHLWTEHKNSLRFLTVVMGLYVIASVSFLAIGLYSGFVLIFFLRKVSQLKTGRLTGVTVFAAGIVVAVLVIGLIYTLAQKAPSIIGDEGQFLGKFQALANGKVPLNVQHRLGDWTLYMDWIGESKRTLLFGHAEPPPREVKTSAHNWYLDFSYNFGLIALLPLLVLISYTTWLNFRFRKVLPDSTVWLAIFVAFIVLVDSNFKVTLRQPYPGIFAYFLWGLLLTRLRTHAKTGSAD